VRLPGSACFLEAGRERQRGGEFVKRSRKLFALVAVTISLLLTMATPALAQEYYVDDSIGFGFLCCYGLAGLLGLAFFILWVWMLIDAIQRQEYEFPNSSGNSKIIWIVLLVLVQGLAALAYYFMVYRQVKRGSVPPPGGGYGGGGYQPPTGGAGAPPPPGAGGGYAPPPQQPQQPQQPSGGNAPPPPPPAGQ
jgi:hypothetical protein